MAGFDDVARAVSTSDAVRTGPRVYDAVSNPNFSRAYADAPTLMDYAANPSLSNFTRVLGLAGRVLSEQTTPQRADVSMGIMPGLPNPSNLPLTKVMSGGKPTRVYRGTSAAYEAEDPSKWDRNALYGPGAYFTENPEVASGYSNKLTPVFRDGNWTVAADAPNVRPAYLDITKPFDVEAPEAMQAAEKILRAAGKWRKASSGVKNGTLNFPNAYDYLKYGFDGDGAAINRALQRAGFDGITHTGGAITGGDPHKVWIGFRPEQVVNPFEYETGLRGVAQKLAR